MRFAFLSRTFLENPRYFATKGSPQKFRITPQKFAILDIPAQDVTVA